MSVPEVNAEMKNQSPPTEKCVKEKLTHLKKGMRVSIPTTAFDGNVPGSWSKGKPPLTFGHLLGWRKNRRATVLWEGQKKVNPQ